MVILDWWNFCFSLVSTLSGKSQPFQENVKETRNSVNDVRDRDNLFSITSQIFPQVVELFCQNAVTQLRSYAVA